MQYHCKTETPRNLLFGTTVNNCIHFKLAECYPRKQSQNLKAEKFLRKKTDHTTENCNLWNSFPNIQLVISYIGIRFQGQVGLIYNNYTPR